MQYLFPEEAVRDLYAIRPELEPMFERIDKTLQEHHNEITTIKRTFVVAVLAGIILMLYPTFQKPEAPKPEPPQVSAPADNQIQPKSKVTQIPV